MLLHILLAIALLALILALALLVYRAGIKRGRVSAFWAVLSVTAKNVDLKTQYAIAASNGIIGQGKDLTLYEVWQTIFAEVERIEVAEDGSGTIFLRGDNGNSFPETMGPRTLHFDSSYPNIKELEGRHIWGTMDSVIIASKTIAERMGNQRIRFVDHDSFTEAIEAEKKRLADLTEWRQKQCHNATTTNSARSGS